MESTTPVTPPMVNRKMKPIAQIIGVRSEIEPPHIVAIQENTLMPVGTAMTMRGEHEIALRVSDMPTVYMWCAQTTKPTMPIATMA